MSSDGQRPPAGGRSASPRSRTPSSSLRPLAGKIVVTSPPWARDEPPSPWERDPQTLFSGNESTQQSEPRSSDVVSSRSSLAEIPGSSRWWTFAKYRPQDSYEHPLTKTQSRQSIPSPTRDRALSIPWLTMGYRQRNPEEGGSHSKDKEMNKIPSTDEPRPSRPSGLHVDLPPPPTSPFTLSHNITPGWDTPWASRTPQNDVHEAHPYQSADDQPDHEGQDDDEKLSTWQARRKRFRVYILYNAYVPLLFRIFNIVLTTAALVMAVQIRKDEQRHGIMGALGSSPTLVIIFASMTLVHVMIAIYFEYFGRPLGLWRTSAKLGYTLLEVVFICLWSAALALSFDNYFTSVIPCVSPSAISWYSSVPRPESLSSPVGDEVCDEQVALICLVGVGLTMYCSNLIINLFRIFEKVKYHPTTLYP